MRCFHAGFYTSLLSVILCFSVPRFNGQFNCWRILVTVPDVLRLVNNDKSGGAAARRLTMGDPNGARVFKQRSNQYKVHLLFYWNWTSHIDFFGGTTALFAFDTMLFICSDHLRFCVSSMPRYWWWETISRLSSAIL